MSKKSLINKSVFYIFIIGSCAPLILLLILTISASWPYPQLLPKTLSLKYITYVFSGNSDTLKAIMTSVIIAILCMILTIAIAIPTAKALALYRFKGKEFIKILVLLPLVVPSITVTTGIQIAMIKLGLTGTMLGVTLIHTVFTLPYAIRLLINVFEIVGDKYENQASTLGANSFQIFKSITIPIIMPGILSAAVMSFTISLSQYITTFLIGGGKIVTIPMLFIPYIQSGQAQVASVYSLLFIFAALISLILMEKTVKKYYNLEGLFYV
ncbi:ABC transporter permease subunit [Clostridium sp.]|uniref:ABC transporter permease n=1 Tax=Clostridium sp. TaxID=1506 RepID=UPI002FC8B1B7